MIRLEVVMWCMFHQIIGGNRGRWTIRRRIGVPLDPLFWGWDILGFVSFCS